MLTAARCTAGIPAVFTHCRRVTASAAVVHWLLLWERWCAKPSSPVCWSLKGADTCPHALFPLFVLQLFNQADPALADLDETPDHMGADLMASRHDAWEELVMSKVRVCVNRGNALSHIHLFPSEGTHQRRTCSCSWTSPQTS